MNRPVGRPKGSGNPATVLRDAAILFSGAVEAGDDLKTTWNRLRKAALRYQEGPRVMGRPRKRATA